MKFWKRVLRGSIIVVIIISVFIFFCNLWVVQSTQSGVLNDESLLPDKSIGLVLGTSHKLLNGQPNPFFEDRISAAALLYQQGKVSHLILSGDNRTRYYNEPLEMKKALLKRGVPDSVITLDYAGLRTLDSIVRCKEIFGQSRVIIITQTFHGYRALFISKYYNMDAVAWVADETHYNNAAKVYFREYFARAKAVLDLYLLGTEPRHLGDKEPLNI